MNINKKTIASFFILTFILSNRKPCMHANKKFAASNPMTSKIDCLSGIFSKLFSVNIFFRYMVKNKMHQRTKPIMPHAKLYALLVLVTVSSVNRRPIPHTKLSINAMEEYVIKKDFNSTDSFVSKKTAKRAINHR